MKIGRQSLSIRTRLTLLATVSSFFAILVTCLSFAAHDMKILQGSRVVQLQTQAEMLGFNSAGVLLFNDEPAAEELLQSLGNVPDIQQAVLFNSQDEPLAAYVRPESDLQPASVIPDLGESEYRFSSGERLELVHPVVEGDDRIGTLYLQVSTEGLTQQIAEYRSIMLTVVGIALMVALLLALILQSGISVPIQKLADLAHRISSEGDYSLRVQTRASGELGTLNAAFDLMLDQIEESKEALRMANRDLAAARDAAEAANAAKSEWLANMSHEIRTPLNAILGFTELLRRGADQGDEAERQDYLQTIHRSGEHLLRLINDILDISRIEAGRMSVELCECSPHAVLAEVVSVLRVRAVEKKLSLDYRWKGPVPTKAVTDPFRLRQIVINLVGNAIKFTEQGGVRIEASVDLKTPEPQLVIDVIDTGIGIPADKLDSVFEAFRQADTSVTRRFGGTGLGLSISHRMAELLGGSLSVQSVPGEGSTFSVRVAAGKVAAESLAQAVETPECLQVSTPDAVEPNVADSRILVVDDGDTNRKLVRLVLEKKGAQVSVACDGREGLKAATAREFDLILMDMQMPVMDGYTATRELRNRGFIQPIIALTAHAMRGDMEKCLDAGCSDYLTKPIDPGRLLTVVSDALHSYRMPADRTAGAGGEQATGGPDSNGPEIHSTLPLDDPDFCEIVVEFLDQLGGRLDEMQDAFNRRDWERLAERAHWLKGVGGSAGFSCLVGPSELLYTAARQECGERADGQLKQLRHLASHLARPVPAGENTTPAI